MISLEMAIKLKSAGLVWEPQIGDMFYWHNGKDWETDALTSEDVNDNLEETRDFIDEGAWILALGLEQLLAKIYEIYNFTLHSSGYIVLRKKGSGMVAEHFHSDTLENAAASALLWILERED